MATLKLEWTDGDRWTKVDSADLHSLITHGLQYQATDHEPVHNVLFDIGNRLLSWLEKVESDAPLAERINAAHR